MGDQLANLESLPTMALTIVVCLLTLVMTEIASNTATCTILMPVIKKMVCVHIKVNSIIVKVIVFFD